MYLLLAIILLYIAGDRLPALTKFRQDKQLNARQTNEGVPPAYALADGLLGGFRGFFISTLWMRAQNMKNDGKYYEMVDIYRIISTMEPNYPNAWANMAWDLSYNVAAEFSNDPEERVYWIFRGIHMLRNQAIRHNPRSARLYFELAWIFYNKAADSIDPAFPLYRKYIAIEVLNVLRSTGPKQQLQAIVAATAKYPSYKDFLKLESVKALSQELTEAGYKMPEGALQAFIERDKKTEKILKNKEKLKLLTEFAALQVNKSLRKELNMDPAVMLLLNEKFGNINWLLPQAHSLYWAWLGQDARVARDPNYKKMRYDRLVYFSLIQLAHHGQGMITQNMTVIGRPDPEILDNTIKFMKDLLEKYEGAAGHDGMKAGFMNLLRTSIFNYYFLGDMLKAEQIRQQLIDISGQEEGYGGNLSDFVRSEIPDFIDGLLPDQAMSLLISFCSKAYYSLSLGATKKFQEQNSWFESNYIAFYKNWVNRVQESFSHKKQFGMPPINELRASIAARILLGLEKFPEKRIKSFDAALKKVQPEIWKQAQDIVKAQKSKNQVHTAPGAPAKNTADPHEDQ